RNSGKTQKDLANHLGINDSAISKLKHGKRRFLADELHRISDYLGVAAPSFPADNEQRTPQRATNDADAKLARIRAVLQVTDEVERVRELHEQDQKLRQLLGLCEFHDIIK